MSTLRQKILDNLTGELRNIKKENGYNFDIGEVKKGFFDGSAINNFPTICVHYYPDINRNQIEGLHYGESDLQVAILTYLETNAENQTEEAEKLIEDLFKFFNRDESTAKEFTSTLGELECVQNYVIKETSPYLAGTNTMTMVGMLLEIDYINFIDSEELPIPDVPILVRPGNGEENASLKTALDWGNVNEAIGYRLQVTSNDFTINVIDQKNIVTSSYTIPEDLSLADGTTYKWRVQSLGKNKNSEWSEEFSFTVNDSAITSKTPNELGSCILWVKSDTGVTTTTGNKVTSWSDQSGGGNNLVQGTDANRPVLTTNAFGVNSGIYLDALGGIRKTLGYNDTTGKFGILTGEQKSIMVTVLPDENWIEGNNGIGLVSLANANYGNNWIIGKYNDNLSNIRGVLQFPKYNTSQVVPLPLKNDLLQLVVTYDGTNCRSYINGKLTSKLPRSITSPIANNVSTWLTVGAEYHTANNSIDYKGYVFEVAYWNKSLVKNEVEELYKYFENKYIT